MELRAISDLSCPAQQLDPMIILVWGRRGGRWAMDTGRGAGCPDGGAGRGRRWCAMAVRARGCGLDVNCTGLGVVAVWAPFREMARIASIRLTAGWAGRSVEVTNRKVSY